jgi:hypothetical protein
MEPASPRITASEVCRLAGYSRVTLARRVKSGVMPAPVDRGRERLFDRLAVYKALGISTETEQHDPEETNPWGRVVDAVSQRRIAAVHGRKETA